VYKYEFEGEFCLGCNLSEFRCLFKLPANVPTLPIFREIYVKISNIKTNTTTCNCSRLFTGSTLSPVTTSLSFCFLLNRVSLQQAQVLPLKAEYTFQNVHEAPFLGHTNHQQDFWRRSGFKNTILSASTKLNTK
jgi:hypothetical protein